MLRCDKSLTTVKTQEYYCLSLINESFYSVMKGNLTCFTQFVFDKSMLAIIHLFVLF